MHISCLSTSTMNKYRYRCTPSHSWDGQTKTQIKKEYHQSSNDVKMNILDDNFIYYKVWDNNAYKYKSVMITSQSIHCQQPWFGRWGQCQCGLQMWNSLLKSSLPKRLKHDHLYPPFSNLCISKTIFGLKVSFFRLNSDCQTISPTWIHTFFVHDTLKVLEQTCTLPHCTLWGG